MNKAHFREGPKRKDRQEYEISNSGTREGEGRMENQIMNNNLDSRFQEEHYEDVRQEYMHYNRKPI